LEEIPSTLTHLLKGDAMDVLRSFVCSSLLLVTCHGMARTQEEPAAASSKPQTATAALSKQDLQRCKQLSLRDEIYLLQLQQRYDARQLELLAINNIRAQGHETNMRIIDNLRPSGRYEYNPTTGHYDRYVPYR
jgi:hypothetical protein